MENDTEELEGILYEGKPLIHHLEDEERDKKSREVEEIRKEAEVKVYKGGSHPDDRQTKFTRRVSKRVKRLPGDQIRREYGIMKKPYKTHMGNMLWVIRNHGPVSTREIMNVINWPDDKYSSASALTSTIWKRLGNTHLGSAGVLLREKTERSDGGAGIKPYRFHFKPDYKLDTDQIITLCKEVERVQRKAEQVESATVAFKRKQDAIDRGVVFPDPGPGLKEDIERAIRQNLGVNVKVSGRIEIVFRLGGA